MIHKSLFFLAFLILLLSGPALASAGFYEVCDINPETNECFEGTIQDVYFEGLVPCGKEVVIGVQTDADGNPVLSDGHPVGGEEDYITCQLCHFLVMADNMVKFVMVWIVPLIAVAMFAIAGIMLYTSGGSRERVDKSKGLFKAVVIGLTIIYGAWLLVTVSLFLIGVEEWTGLSDGWYQVHCPIQYPEDSSGAPIKGTPPEGGHWEPCNPADEDCVSCEGEFVHHEWLGAMGNASFTGFSSPCPEGEIAERGLCRPGPCDDPDAPDQVVDPDGSRNPDNPRIWTCRFTKNASVIRSVSGRIFRYCMPEE